MVTPTYRQLHKQRTEHMTYAPEIIALKTKSSSRGVGVITFSPGMSREERRSRVGEFPLKFIKTEQHNGIEIYMNVDTLVNRGVITRQQADEKMWSLMEDFRKKSRFLHSTI